jgi:hypothetical protein
MNKSVRTSLTALCAAAALFAIPATASAATGATLSIKAPCSKSSTGKVTVTAKAKAGFSIGFLGVSKTKTPKSNADLLFGKPSASVASYSVSGKVPVGKKFYAFTAFSNGLGGGNLFKAFTVKKCAAFTG